MPKLNFQPLFEYLDERFGDMNRQFNEIKQTINTHITAIDATLKQGEDNRKELISNRHTLDQHEERIGTVESKLGIEFKH